MRKPTEKEKYLLRKLTSQHDLDTILVTSLDDGGMGSLAIGENYTNRKFGKMINEYQFTDLDCVDVIASLYVDTDGKLYELDIFKTNFNPTLMLSKKD